MPNYVRAASGAPKSPIVVIRKPTPPAMPALESLVKSVQAPAKPSRTRKAPANQRKPGDAKLESLRRTVDETNWREDLDLWRRLNGVAIPDRRTRKISAVIRNA